MYSVDKTSSVTVSFLYDKHLWNVRSVRNYYMKVDHRS